MSEPFTIWSPPPPAGAYRIGNSFTVQISKRPNWFHRTMVRLILGWVWIDN